MKTLGIAPAPLRRAPSVKWALKSFTTALLAVTLPSLSFAEPIAVGVSVTLTGDAATFGVDMKNAISLAEEELGTGRYKLIYEDEQCAGKSAVSVAQKFISVDRVRYVIGFSCNQSLIPAAPVYQRAGIPVISAFGTSGDIESLGESVFRLFPADHLAVHAIFPYIRARHSVIGIVTEENEYPELMRRTFERLSREQNVTLIQESFATHDTDLRQVLLRFKNKSVPALFLNPNAEPSFIRLVQQLGQINYHPVLYTVYWPSASVVREAVGGDLEGIVFANLPDPESILSEKGKGVLARYRARFGEPQSVPYNVAFAYESFRLLDEAVQSGKPVAQYLHENTFTSGTIGKYSFDEHGAVIGLTFELQELRNGILKPLARK